MNIQQRIQRTYRVALTPFATTDEPTFIEVNLSYELAEDLASPNHASLQAEAIARLRRLASQGRATSTAGQPVTVDDIDTSEWAAKVVRQTLVTIELDANGKPIRQAR